MYHKGVSTVCGILSYPCPSHFNKSKVLPIYHCLYLLISWSSCLGFPRALRVLTFHVPMLISFQATLIRVLFPVLSPLRKLRTPWPFSFPFLPTPPVAHFPTPPWVVGDAVVFILGPERISMELFIVSLSTIVVTMSDKGNKIKESDLWQIFIMCISKDSACSIFTDNTIGSGGSSLFCRLEQDQREALMTPHFCGAGGNLRGDVPH